MNATIQEQKFLIRTAQGEGDLAEIRKLFREYADSLEIDLCFQNFEDELNALPGKYAPPHGAILLAEAQGRPAGCVALRRIEDGVCEMKRLFVRGAFRSLGMGKALAVAIIERARAMNYRTMKLDTLTTMKSAVALYGALGFVDTAPYIYNPIPEAKYMELSLQEDAGR